MHPMNSSARPDWFALAGVATTIVLHFILQAERPNIVFIIGACVCWAAFVAVRAWQDRGIFHEWGFRVDNLGRATVIPAIVFVIVAASFATYARYAHGTIRLPAKLPLLLMLYPFWGWVQQFLTLGLVIGNLERVEVLRQRTWLVGLLGATLFGLVHAYDIRLFVATFLVELLIIALYRRQRNLWPLGVLHGWVGALYYLWVLDRDMWVENFG